MGQLYGRVLQELSLTHLVAVAGHSQASTQSAATALNVPGYASETYRQMFAEHPEIQAVVVAASEWAHLDPVLASLDAGKHVLVEKPLATSLADATQMVTRAEQTGSHLMVCHTLRFDPRFVSMHEAVVRGDIGAVLHMHGRRNPGQGAVDRVLGRFPLTFWLSPHDIDMMIWTAGAPPLRVNVASREGAKTRQDYILATMTFANGVTGILENSWGTPGLAGQSQNPMFSVKGTAGVAEVKDYENGVAIYRAGGTIDYPDTVHNPVIYGQIEGVNRSMIRHFAGIVLGLWPPAVTGRDGLAVIRVADAMAHSLEEGREVTV